MLLAPVPLTVVCVEIASNVVVLKTNGKPMNLHAFRVFHVRVASSFRRRHFCGSLSSVGRCRCPEVGLGILDSTSEGSQEVKSRKRKPTSGHQERPAKVVDAIKDIEQKKHAKLIGFY